ncbi:LOW QUALITY PROTEIN: leukocyte elastase inhibitor-like [Penaeus monodon]|uniref:LOW QUALITY PROTEIN: leukocyte elastase inhibitor-like n=1 Tax=Penaeus monodon TaxID=6687 RepID=UPI0018A768B1|nr:LOW QUALITY PROTEIN: leukocyte elastase inhibitor-like [Penaeus monodon]
MRLTVTTAVLAAALGLARPQCFSARDDFSVRVNNDISGITDFGFELYRQLAPPQSPENFFFSPYSIWMAFTLVYFGTGGETAAQLQRALRVDDQVATLKLWRELEAMYDRRQAGTTDYTFSTANRQYVDKRLSVRPCVAEILRAELETIDFRDRVSAARTINRFAFEKTNGKISDVVSADELNRAVMAIVNAAYFKSTWQVQFNPEHTQPMPFYATPERPHTVPMMELESSFNYGDFSQIAARVVELPYKGKAMSMFIFLPSEEGPRGFTKMVSRLSSNNLRAATNVELLNRRLVEVRLPKFKLDVKVEGLIPALMNTGITDLFSFDKANFTTLGPLREAAVKTVIHKAFVEVNEEGTEAAAVTVAVVPVRSFVPRIPFHCNRPFVFLIRDNATRTFLFMGAYKDPGTAT